MPSGDSRRVPQHGPGAADAALKDVENAIVRLKRVREAAKDYSWEQYARTLRTRVQAQRTEIARLHLRMRSLRADIHERDERIAELEGGSRS